MDYNRTNIIAALATTPGISAISVIRISGANLTDLYKAITGKSKVKNRYANYCTIWSEDKKIALDKCIIIYYANPNSYTGEDVIEINCHGGEVVAKSILNMLYSYGVQSALPGEFSYRAFLNNKIDLIEAEAISSLIHSSSEYSSEIIMDHLNQSLTKQILSINKQIIDILTIIEHELDFSENEIDYTTNETILEIIQNIASTIKEYLKNKKTVKAINNGINVVILGIPNAGKSSLFNELVGKNRTIVSNQKGTTRDSVEAKIILNQYPINLIDTAGYFEANDQINIDSVKQTIYHAKSAELIIYVDENNPINEFNKFNIKCNHVIYCKSKQDSATLKVNADKSINISSKTNYGISELKKQLSTLLSTEYEYNINNQTALISERQIIIFEQALEILLQIEIMLKEDSGMDLVASYMHQLNQLLDECLGKISNEEVLSSIFNNFCVGK